MVPDLWWIMSALSLAEMLTELYVNENVGAFERLYLHRAIRRSRGELIFGRDAIRQQALADLAQFSGWRFQVNASTDRFADVEWLSPDNTSVRRHYWITLENGRISQDIVITRAPDQEPMKQHHQLLGELDSGKGQAGPSDLIGFSATAQSLHRIWNGKSVSTLGNLYDDNAHWSGPSLEGGVTELKNWWLAQFLAFPQSHITFERELSFENGLALLWQWARIDVNGRRDRVAGSTYLRLEGSNVSQDVTLTD
nr:nuclear transport factor 2 family protein [Dolichospermum circinale]